MAAAELPTSVDLLAWVTVEALARGAVEPPAAGLRAPLTT